MIQELLSAVVEDRKMLSNNNNNINSNNMLTSLIIDNSPANSSPLQSAASSPTSAAAASTENLRCPRCDSANTKFCYYNNYNLTQPRHFCKTCRRYWTKGGALRNVPIGGGCRKTKAAAAIPSAIKSRGTARPMGLAGGGGGGEHDHLLPSSPILWGGCSTPHSSHLLALLRASQAQQQNHSTHSILNSIRVKEEGCCGPQVSAFGLDPWGQFCSNNNNNDNNSSMYQNQNLFLGDAPTSSGIQELYQRLRAPGNRGGSEHLIVGSNVGSGNASSAAATTTATVASLLEPMPLSALGGDFGYWNPGMAWADLPTTNGAFP